MRVYNRKLKILQELIDCDDFISSGHLSQRVGVSSRTIRNDMKQLGSELEAKNIALISIPGKGYSLHIQDKEKAFEYFSKKWVEKKAIPATPQSRVYHILQNLLFAEQPITFDELTTHMFISQSTLEKDLIEAEKWLAAQNIALVKNPSTGIQAAGREIALRYAMVNCLLEQHSQYPLSLLDLLTGIVDKNQLKAIKEIIREIQKFFNFHLSDSDYKHLNIYLSIALNRVIRKNEPRSCPEEAEQILSKTEYKIAGQIAVLFKSALNIDLSEPEIVYLAKYLMQTHLFEVNHLSPEDLESLVQKDYTQFIKRTVSIIEKQFITELSEDRELIYGLVLYLESLLNRKKHRILIKNPGLDEIKAAYPNALEMAIAASEAIYKQYQFDLNEDEIGYIALYFCAAIERKKAAKAKTPLKVVIICSIGIAGSQLLAVKIKRYFPNLVVDGVYPAQRISEARQRKPDIIISTTPLEEQDIPVILVSHLLNDDDFNNLRNFIGDASHFDDDKNKQSFLGLFSPELFISGIEINHRDEIIQMLSAKLLEHGYADEHFAQAVIKRELLFSTAIGNLVAIPHALPSHSSGSHIAVGILKKPILWGKDKVQLVFLLNIQNTPEENFNRIYEHFFDIVNAQHKIKNIIKAENFDQFIKEIS